MEQPHAIKAYNQGMGWVDLVDRALSDLRPNFNGKKRYWSLVINALNLGLVHCWRLHQLCTNSRGGQKSFRRAVVNVLLMKARNNVGRPGPSFTIPDEVQLDGQGHYPAPGPVRKCVFCKRSGRNVCEKCKKKFTHKIMLPTISRELIII